MPIATRPNDADAVEHHGPRKQERDLEIENDEEDGDEVIAHVEFHAAVFESLEAALVRRELLRVAARLGFQRPMTRPSDISTSARPVATVRKISTGR